MSNDENSNESEEASKPKANALSNTISKLMALKESNPKVLYGVIAGLVVVILVIMLSGGSENKLPANIKTNVAVGQSYELISANTYDKNSTVRLVAVPRSMAAYDDTEAADRIGDCKHMPQGTKVKVIKTQTSLTALQFVEVEMIAGECAGKKGWLISSNLR